MSEPESRFYEFGEFRLDTEERQLSKNGRPVQITFRAYDVLRVLVANGGRIMEKDDLMEAVWGETIVEEGNLKNLVYSLRKVLGDETGKSQFIQTLPKRGYRFVAEVKAVPFEGLVIERHSETEITIEEQIEIHCSEPTAIEAAAQPAVETKALPPLPNSKALSYKLWLPAVLVSLIILTAGAYWFKLIPRTTRVLALENAKVTSLTFGTSASAPVISPDGKFVAYIALEARGRSLCVRQLVTNNTLKLMDLALSDSLWDLEFSADSNFVYIALGRDEFPKGVLYQISAIGGQPRKLLEGIGSFTVSPADGQLAFLRDKKLFAISANGQNERELFDTNEKFNAKMQSLVWAPDGKSFIASVSRFDNNVPYWQIIEFPLDGASERTIGARFPKPVSILATPDGTGIIALDIDDDAFTSKVLYLSRYDSEPPRVLTKDINYYSILSMTADGKTLLAGRMARPTQLWVAPAADLAQPVAIASGFMGKVNWTNNGRIVSDAIENGQTDIWSYNAENGERQQLTNNSKRNNNPNISPDNKYIFYTSNLSGRSQLWRMKPDGSEPQQLTNENFSIVGPRVAPNSESVYFTAFTEDKWQIYRTGKDGGALEKIIAENTNDFAISPGGDKIVYVKFDDQSKKEILIIHDLVQNTADKTLSLPHGIYWTLKWSPDGQALEYIGNETSTTSCIYSQSLNGGDPKIVKCLKNETFVSFGWSPDKEKLAFTSCHYIFDAVLFSLN